MPPRHFGILLKVHLVRARFLLSGRVLRSTGASARFYRPIKGLEVERVSFMKNGGSISNSEKIVYT